MEENNEKKMSLQEWSMHYRQIIILLVSCLVALGIFGLANINKNEFLSWCYCTGDGGTGDQAAGEIHLSIS